MHKNIFRIFIVFLFCSFLFISCKQTDDNKDLMEKINELQQELDEIKNKQPSFENETGNLVKPVPDRVVTTISIKDLEEALEFCDETHVLRLDLSDIESNDEYEKIKILLTKTSNGRFVIDLTNFFKLWELEEIPDQLFENWTTVIEFILPENGISDIGPGAFKGCTALEKINFPRGIEVVGEEAFYNCSSLAKIDIPNTVRNIEGFAFGNCIKLEINVPYYVEYEKDSFSNVRKVNFINDIKERLFISGDVYSDCFKNISSEDGGNVREIEILEGVNKVNISAFKVFPNLEKIIVPNTFASIDWEFVYDVEYRDDSFILVQPDYFALLMKKRFVRSGEEEYNIYAITEYVLPEKVLSIGERAFYGCLNLKNFQFHENIESIKEDSFFNCFSLRSVLIPDSVTNLERGCFEFCHNMEEIKLSKKLTKIPNYAFYGCNKLKEIIIPDSIKTIEFGAFGGCEVLEKVTLGRHVSFIETDVVPAFKDCVELKTIDNYSSLLLVKGSSDNGEIAKYASEINDFGKEILTEYSNKILFCFDDLSESDLISSDDFFEKILNGVIFNTKGKLCSKENFDDPYNLIFEDEDDKKFLLDSYKPNLESAILILGINGLCDFSLVTRNAEAADSYISVFFMDSDLEILRAEENIAVGYNKKIEIGFLNEDVSAIYIIAEGKVLIDNIEFRTRPVNREY